MGIRLKDITAFTSDLLAAGNTLLTNTSGSLTRLVRWDTLADWILKTYAGFTQSGSGAISETMQSRNRWEVYVTDYMTDAVRANVLAGGLNPTEDATSAFTAAIAAATASNIRTIRIPAGSYLISSTITIPTGYTFKGDGVARTILVFRPSAGDTMIEVTAGASIAYNCTIGGFSCYSDDETYTKVALELSDVSSCRVDDIYIYGSATGNGLATFWSGSNSIGIRTKGRDSTHLNNLKIAADYPIYIAANPNTDADDGEDMDHWDWSNCYLIANGQYCITVADGIGLNEVTFDGYQAWVGGVGGIKINDTRAAPTVPSRGIMFKNVRTEQSTSSSGYAFNLVFTSPVLSIGWEKVLMSADMNGITINGFNRAVLDQVVSAPTSGTAIVTAGATASSVLVMRGCIWTSGASVTLTGLTQIHAQAYRSASFAAPSDAVYAGQITDTTFNVGKARITGVNAAVGFVITGTTGDGLQMLPQAAGSGIVVRAVNNAESDFEPLTLLGETVDIRYRTGVATSAVALNIGTTGKTTAIAPTTAGASINLPHGTAPSSPVDGDMWTTTDGLYVRINGSTVGPLS